MYTLRFVRDYSPMHAVLTHDNKHTRDFPIMNSYVSVINIRNQSSVALFKFFNI